MYLDLFRNSIQFSRKRLLKIAFSAIDLAIFRCDAPYEGTGKASCAVMPAPTVIITASMHSTHEYLHTYLDLFRNSIYFSRKRLLKIAFSAIDLAIFRCNAPYEGTGEASCAVMPAPTVIITASTHSTHEYLHTYLDLF